MLVVAALAPLMAFQAPVTQFRNAVPGYKYEFPAIISIIRTFRPSGGITRAI